MARPKISDGLWNKIQFLVLKARSRGVKTSGSQLVELAVRILLDVIERGHISNDLEDEIQKIASAVKGSGEWYGLQNSTIRREKYYIYPFPSVSEDEDGTIVVTVKAYHESAKDIDDYVVLDLNIGDEIEHIEYFTDKIAEEAVRILSRRYL